MRGFFIGERMKIIEPAIEDLMDSLLYYVPTGTTEGEKHILQDAFVQTHEYAEIIAPPLGSPRLLIGKKGSGKSAILDFTMRFLEQSEIPAILIKPLNIDLSGMLDNAPSGELTRIAYKTLTRTVANCIGAQLSGLVTGDNEELLNAAISAGERDRDAVGKLSILLNKISAPFTGYDFSKILPNASEANCKRLEKAVSRNISQSDKAFYLLIDDTDQVALPGSPGHLNKVWAILLAARELTQANNKIRCIICLRDEIWRALGAQGAGQRDQLDHFITLTYFLNPTLDHVQEIVEKRLMLAAEKCGIHESTPNYSLFFSGRHPKMPTSEKTSSWPDIIRSRSRERPRDAIQLINKMTKLALDGTPKQIDENILASVMPIYSKERADLLANEFERECPTLLRIIESFSSIPFNHGAFLIDSEQLKAHFSEVLTSFGIELNGITIKNTETDIFKIWSFLYSAEFFYPRISDDRQPSGYRFIKPSEEPKFVRKENWNEIQKILWEIHPVYRDFLITVQRNESARFGLPTKRPKDTKRKKR